MRVREKAGRETEEMENTGRGGGKNRTRITISKDRYTEITRRFHTNHLIL